MKKPLLVVLMLAGHALQSAHAADWKMDGPASKLEFAATFETSPAPGVFKQFDVQLNLDPEKAAGGRLDVTIKTASADMASADINKAIAGPEWFDFAKFPQAEFHATDIRRTEANNFVARGTLALKGVQQPVDVPFTWSDSADGATMDGKFTVKRGPFGIGTGEWVATNVIGPDVTVTFHVRLRKVS
jgi:polyisoprenoid-binding protein YceI